MKHNKHKIRTFHFHGFITPKRMSPKSQFHSFPCLELKMSFLCALWSKQLACIKSAFCEVEEALSVYECRLDSSLCSGHNSCSSLLSPISPILKGSLPGHCKSLVNFQVPDIPPGKWVYIKAIHSIPHTLPCLQPGNQSSLLQTPTAKPPPSSKS